MWSSSRWTSSGSFPFGIAAGIGFVGSKSSHLSLGAANINSNALYPQLLSLGSALTQSVANPFYGHGGTGVIGTAIVQESQLLLPYPTYGAINAMFNDYNKAKYDSFVFKAQKNLSARHDAALDVYLVAQLG